MRSSFTQGGAMSATKKTGIRRDPLDVERLLKQNPNVDVDKLREAQEVLRDLRRGGVSGPRYQIDSPYERGPISKPESARRHK